MLQEQQGLLQKILCDLEQQGKQLEQQGERVKVPEYDIRKLNQQFTSSASTSSGDKSTE